jgi:predicted phosphoribosyltransferase
MRTRGFVDRRDAGHRLAISLGRYTHYPDLLVLALPRGGVPVAFEVATRLGAELDVILVRKLGFPGHEELAIGAIASGGTVVLNEDLIEKYAVDRAAIQRVVLREELELERREQVYRRGLDHVRVLGRTVILVDDGFATGATMRAAARAVRAQNPRRLVIAAPVAAPEACAELGDEADETVCLFTPMQFGGVGRWYDDFAPTSDQEVVALLEAARESHRESIPLDAPPSPSLPSRV